MYPEIIFKLQPTINSPLALNLGNSINRSNRGHWQGSVPSSSQNIINQSTHTRWSLRSNPNNPSQLRPIPGHNTQNRHRDALPNCQKTSNFAEMARNYTKIHRGKKNWYVIQAVPTPQVPRSEEYSLRQQLLQYWPVHVKPHDDEPLQHSPQDSKMAARPTRGRSPHSVGEFRAAAAALFALTAKSQWLPV